MKLTITKSDLVDALNTVKGAASTRTTLPILENCKISPSSETINIAATNLNLWIETSIPAKVEEGFDVTIPLEKLKSIVTSIQHSVIFIESTGPNSVTVSGGKSKFKVNTISADQFPAPVTVDPHFTGVIPKLITGIKSVFHAIPQENFDRREMIGANIVIDGSLSVAASDGKRLAFFHTEDPIQGTANVIIPAPTAKEICSLFTETEAVNVMIGSDSICLSTPSLIVSSKLLEGRFPNFQPLLTRTLAASETQRELFINRSECEDLVRRSTITVDRGVPRIKITIGENSVQYLTKNNSGEFTEDMDVKVTGLPMEIEVNPFYFADMIKAFNTPEVTIRMTDSKNPIVVLNGSELTCLTIPLVS